MKSFRVLGHQAKYVGAAFAMLVATFAPLLTTTSVGAEQLTQRSVQLSSSSKDAEDVDYQFTFTATAAGAGAEGVVVQFCSNTPLMLETCTAPADLDASDVSVTGATLFTGSSPANNKVQLTKTIATGANTFTISGITNPSAAGTMYARIITYATDTNTNNYTTSAFGSGKVDDGAVAVSITDSIGVSGDVLESLIYCVSANAIPDVCATVATPTLELGSDVGGGVIALGADIDNNSKPVYTQISTNAVGGAVVRLKTNNTCGGLKRANVSTCDIAAAGTSDWTTNGEAKFGVKVDTAADLGGATGAFVADAGYSNTGYRLEFDDDDVTGVTSPYGDPVLTTSGAPATGQNAMLTFGAAIAPNTPAGRYTAALSLVATGTF